MNLSLLLGKLLSGAKSTAPMGANPGLGLYVTLSSRKKSQDPEQTIATLGSREGGLPAASMNQSSGPLASWGPQLPAPLRFPLNWPETSLIKAEPKEG